MSRKEFIPLESLRRGGPPAPSETLAAIRRIYFETTRRTIQDDLAQAIQLLKQLPDEETRERAAVYMEGLAQMRREWHGASHKSKVGSQKPRARSKFKGRT